MVEGVSEQTNNIVAMSVELAFITLCILFVVLVYFCYYKKKYAVRLQNDPAAQKTLNYEFRLFDG
ncbi:hypothetical protein FACS1894218_3490 [Bacilli bacterium]|nr:hypothetical protein FACS1894218_3490 [Bacilli bacterium]